MRTQLINRTGSFYGATNWGHLPQPSSGDIEVVEGRVNPLTSSTWVGALKTAGCGSGCGCGPCRTAGTTSFVDSTLEDVKAIAADPTAKRPMSPVTVGLIALGVVLIFGR